MKKFLTLLALSAIFGACSTDDTSSSQTIQKSSVVFTIDQPSSSTTGKQIKRNNIPVWVNTIKITANSNLFAPYTTFDNFTFDQQNGSNVISLDNVAVGSNTFVATTTTDSPQFYQFTNFTVGSGSAADKFAAALNHIDNENPYVLYTGTTTATIAATGVNGVSISMNTLNGRLLTVFQLKDVLKDVGLQAKITASVTGLASQTAITKGNELVTFKWSDANSVKDKEVTYKVEISTINNQSDILNTYTIKQTILASTSLSCFFTIDFDDYTFTRNDVGITLNWQEWKNEHCTTCK